MKPSIVVHGGAWDWSHNQDEPKSIALREATRIGWEILQQGGSALDAVEKAVNHLEDAPLFDAGIGSHLNAEGVVEMDALIVDGTARNFGAVAAVQRVQYPISLARRVLEDTNECLYVGAGADKLAERLNIPLIANVQLVTPHELQAFLRHDTSGEAGTVGAVALDSYGNIASATSTGGTPQKPAGRVGDTPIYGAGGYAHSAFGGASATGKGENCLRVLLSRYAVDQMERGLSAQAAANAAIQHLESVIPQPMVGLIVLDAQGQVGIAHATPKIAVAWVDEHGQIQTRMAVS